MEAISRRFRRKKQLNSPDDTIMEDSQSQLLERTASNGAKSSGIKAKFRLSLFSKRKSMSSQSESTPSDTEKADPKASLCTPIEEKTDVPNSKFVLSDELKLQISEDANSVRIRRFSESITFGGLADYKIAVRRTALHSAVEIGMPVDTVVKLLRNTEIDILAVTEDGDTALHLAAKHRNGQMCMYLIHLGGDPNLPNSREQTPMQLAGSELGYEMMLEYWNMLKNRIEKADYVDLAIQACRYGSCQMLFEMVQLGADLQDLKDPKTGYSLFEIARAAGFLELAGTIEKGEIGARQRYHHSTSSLSGSYSRCHHRQKSLYGKSALNNSGILDLNSDEVKELMSQDTGTDLNTPNSISANNGAVICKMEDEDEEEEEEDGNFRGWMAREVGEVVETAGCADKRNKSRFSIRDLP